MSNMSPKSVAQKLLIKPSTTVWSPDSEHRQLIGPLPEDARHVDRLEEANTAVVFASSAEELRRVLTEHEGQLARPGVFWVAYPKGNRADINRDTLWPVLGEHGMRPISQVSVDEVWSALRFRPLAAGEPPFTGGR
jgi:hypothetical protein